MTVDHAISGTRPTTILGFLCGRVLGSAPAIAMLLSLTRGAGAQTVEQLRDLSIDQLGSINIMSVLKSPEQLGDAPAAIYVITHDDIMKSGARRLPEMLRLAPNLQVAQLNASSYAISSRGFNVGINASLSNKLLVVIDGRTVYSPLFGGVYWDQLQVLPEDIERIEVISGPGATLWGSNAVNGVINVITRGSGQTMGGLLTLGAGNLERSGSLQYGGRLASDLTYRVHVEGAQYSPYQKSNGRSAGDRWSSPQGGFRMDWKPDDDDLSLQGDISSARQQPNGYLKSQDLLASWRHRFADGSSVQIQASYDQQGRYLTDGGPGFTLDTYDLELQHSFRLGSRNEIVWGAGERAASYRFENTALQLVPARQSLNLANVFVQDTLSITNRLKLTLGLKVEDEPYTSLQPMPSARLSWKVTDSVLLWTAISRAVRSPTPVDVNLREFAGTVDTLNGSRLFRPEQLTAYEAGLRVQLTPLASMSISAFHNEYDHLRSIERSAGTSGLPLFFGNLAAGTVTGVEVWGQYRPVDWWQLSAGFNLQNEHLRFRPGSSRIGGLAFIADDPNVQASLHSTLRLGPAVSWNTDLRYVGMLPHPVVPEYAELNTRVTWTVSKDIELSLSGYNLLHARHLEFSEIGTTAYVPRSVFLETRLRF